MLFNCFKSEQLRKGGAVFFSDESLGMNHGRSREWDISRFYVQCDLFLFLCGSRIALTVANCVRVWCYFFTSLYRFLLLEDFLVCIHHFYKRAVFVGGEEEEKWHCKAEESGRLGVGKEMLPDAMRNKGRKTRHGCFFYALLAMR